jgi:hypothetical protein
VVGAAARVVDAVAEVLVVAAVTHANPQTLKDPTSAPQFYCASSTA